MLYMCIVYYLLCVIYFVVIYYILHIIYYMFIYIKYIETLTNSHCLMLSVVCVCVYVFTKIPALVA